MENPNVRSWSYTSLRNRTREAAHQWRYRARGLPLALRGVDLIERLVLKAINLAEKLERTTYPSRWERIEDDSINPLG